MQFNGNPHTVQTVVLPGDTIANTAAATDFATQHFIRDNSMVIGHVLYVNAGGPFSTLAVGTRTLNMHLKVGGVTVLSSGVRTPVAAATNAAWTFHAALTVTLDGPGGFIGGHGVWTFYNPTLTSDDTWSAFTFGAAYDSTVDSYLTLGGQWTSADPSNSVAMTNCVVLVGS